MTDPRQIVVLYNSEMAAMMPWRGWKPEDVLDAVFAYATPFGDGTTSMQICEACFAMFQDISRFGIRMRSMSVGDVVIVDERAYKCADTGFEEVPLQLVQIRTTLQIIARRSEEYDGG